MVCGIPIVSAESLLLSSRHIRSAVFLPIPGIFERVMVSLFSTAIASSGTLIEPKIVNASFGPTLLTPRSVSKTCFEMRSENPKRFMAS